MCQIPLTIHIDAAAKSFTLPQIVKTKLDTCSSFEFRGYDVMGTQLYEDDGLPNLKEGFFLGQDISAEDPRGSLSILHGPQCMAEILSKWGT